MIASRLTIALTNLLFLFLFLFYFSKFSKFSFEDELRFARREFHFAINARERFAICSLSSGLVTSPENAETLQRNVAKKDIHRFEINRSRSTVKFANFMP